MRSRSRSNWNFKGAAVGDTGGVGRAEEMGGDGITDITSTVAEAANFLPGLRLEMGVVEESKADEEEFKGLEPEKADLG